MSAKCFCPNTNANTIISGIYSLTSVNFNGKYSIG